MKRTLITTLTATLLLSSPMAFAQGETKSQFVDMEALMVDGQFKRPDFLSASATRPAKFKRLTNLKKSFVSDVLVTAQEKSLAK